MILQELGDHPVISRRKREQTPFLRTVRLHKSGHIGLPDAVLTGETLVVLSPLLRSHVRNVGGLRRRNNHH